MKNKTRFAILTDVDLTLLPSMSTDVPAHRQRFITKLHDRLGGAFALVTGRPGISVDTSFPGGLPASVEHHSAWRPKEGAGYIALAPTVDARALTQFARREINGSAPVFVDKREIQEKKPGFFLEEKNHSIAMIFSVVATSRESIDHLVSIANKALAAFDLAGSHRVAVGSDAVEIVPQGLSKIQAVHHFMDTDAFKGKTPIFIGDSSADANAMKTCMDDYNGFGIAVGPNIPDAPYVLNRIDNVESVWKYLRKFDRTLG